MARCDSRQSEVLDLEARVAVFRPYPFQVGQKIFIDSGLCCPISGREVAWARFCYLVWEGLGEPWPHPPNAGEPKTL